MSVFRQVIAEYLDTIRAYSLEVASVDSGVFASRQPEIMLEQPNVWFQQEAEWIDVLLEGLELIQRYVIIVYQWIDHIKGLMHNLQLTDTQFTQIFENQGGTTKLLQSNTYDPKFLQWILKDVSQEVERLINSTRELQEDAPRLLPVITQVKGPFMEAVKEISATWTSRNLSQLIPRLSSLLEEAAANQGGSETLERLGTYCDTLVTTLASTPLFIDDATNELPSARIFYPDTNTIDTLVEGTKHFQEFIRLRTIAYQRFLDHIVAILRAVLPSTESVTQWIRNFVTGLSQSANELLPEIIATDTVPLAFIQAEDAQNDWAAISKKLIPLRQSAFALNSILQSPTVSKFLSADQRRREITREWLPKMIVKYQALRENLAP